MWRYGRRGPPRPTSPTSRLPHVHTYPHAPTDQRRFLRHPPRRVAARALDVRVLLPRHHLVLDPEADQEEPVHRVLRSGRVQPRAQRALPDATPGLAGRVAGEGAQHVRRGGGRDRVHDARAAAPARAAHVRVRRVLHRGSRRLLVPDQPAGRPHGLDVLPLRRPVDDADGGDVLRLPQRQRDAERGEAALRAHRPRRRGGRRVRHHVPRRLHRRLPGLDVAVGLPRDGRRHHRARRGTPGGSSAATRRREVEPDGVDRAAARRRRRSRTRRSKGRGSSSARSTSSRSSPSSGSTRSSRRSSTSSSRPRSRTTSTARPSGSSSRRSSPSRT